MLLPVLASLVFFSSYSNSQETTSDLLEPSAQEWDGSYNTGYWGGVAGGPNPNRLPNDTGFIWSYGQNAISTTIAINNALQEQGIQVNGYQYKWRVKNANANVFTQQPGIDPFDITVEIYKADGSLYQTYNYDYGHSHNWTNHEGTELFTDNFLPPSFFGNIDITATGQDSGYWAGWYGPEFNVNQSEFNLIYSTNPCHNNPLYNPNCIGYAEAYAQQLYDQQCQASALYDTGCPGYTTANFTQQCTIDPLHDTNCPGYADQILTLTQQEDHHHEEEWTAQSNIIEPEDAYMPTITGDTTIDSILGDLNELPITIVEVEVDEIQAEQITQEVESTEYPEIVETTDVSEENIVKNPFEKNKKKDKSKEKVKQLVTEKAMNLANTMSVAASLDQQKLVQAEILALMDFTPGFQNYGYTLAGGTIPDGQLYKPKSLPESRRGLRNGLAQQILHEKMVDMQWEN